MKKTVTILLTLLLLVALLAACGQASDTEAAIAPDPIATIEPEETTAPDYDYDDEPEAEIILLDEIIFEINISLASDVLLGSFSRLHEVDYTILREANAGGAVESFNGNRLVIWADVPLYDVALISIVDDFADGELTFAPTGSFGHIEEILPGQAFVINAYVGGGTLPTSGISFATANGQRHYFWMQADQSVGMYPNPFVESNFLDMFEDGSLLIEVTRGGGTSQYFTVTLDEIGDTDPVDWFIENQHLWYLFFLVEFAN